MKKILWSIISVVSGFLVVVMLSILTDVVLEKAGIFPNQNGGYLFPWMAALATLYRTIYTILGGYVTASLAPDQKQRHVIILAVLGTIGGIVGVISTWGQTLGPVWYPIALAVLAFPSVWFGGKLKLEKLKK